MPIPTAIAAQTVEVVAAIRELILAVNEMHRDQLKAAQHQSRQIETLIGQHAAEPLLALPPDTALALQVTQHLQEQQQREDNQQQHSENQQDKIDGQQQTIERLNEERFQR
jgi:hypothetical protein